MYIPAAFRVDDPGKLSSHMQRHSFATFITHDGAAPFASHLPMLLRPDVGAHGTLVSHMARANPQWKHFTNGQEALAVFHGPHAYISPTWYQTQPSVPTWNYAAVHAYGIPRLITDHESIAALLRDTITLFEAPQPEPWPGDLPPEYFEKMTQAIVAFELPISRIEGKFKLGQNRSAPDLQGVYDALSHSQDADCQALADIMLSECDVTSR